MGMLQLAQLWCGTAKPVNMIGTGTLGLLEPLNATVPQAVHLIAELRGMGYKLVVGWTSRPHAYSGMAILGTFLSAASDSQRSDSEIAPRHSWRRKHGAMWVSELLRADGRTIRAKYSRGSHVSVSNLEGDAMRLCSTAFGDGLTSPPERPRVGRLRRAAWDGVREGDFVWHDGTLCEVQELEADEVTLRTYSRSGGAQVSRESAHTLKVDGDGSISYAARLVTVGRGKRCCDGRRAGADHG